MSRARPNAPKKSLVFKPYMPLIPDGEYLAFCTHAYWDENGRNWGEKIYVYFDIYDGDSVIAKDVRMYLTPSIHPTSYLYRAWSIANGGPPRSRNTTFSERIFKGKLFRVRTATVKPRHQVTTADGKRRPAEFLPQSSWYSKVARLLSLEATNGPVTDPIFVTGFSPKPFSNCDLTEGEVGRRELGVGSKRDSDFAVRDGKTNTALHNPPAENSRSLPAPSPHSNEVYATAAERQKRALNEHVAHPGGAA